MDQCILYKKIIQLKFWGGIRMNKDEMIDYVDIICEEEGYKDSPAYDLIYSECCEGRTDDDAKEMIIQLLKEYNK